MWSQDESAIKGILKWFSNHFNFFGFEICDEFELE